MPPLTVAVNMTKITNELKALVFEKNDIYLLFVFICLRRFKTLTEAKQLLVEAIGEVTSSVVGLDQRG